MSFLAQLKSAKKSLHPTDTLVRYADGSSVLHIHDGTTQTSPGQLSYGYVVDTQPDNKPVCIIAEWLYLGAQDCVDADIFAKHSIRNCLSVGIEAPHRVANVRHTFIPCLDVPETNLVAVLDQTDDYLDDIKRSGDRVLVHCNAGVSRSTSIVIGYLMRRIGYTYADAHHVVKSKRPCCRPNKGFEIQLQQIENQN